MRSINQTESDIGPSLVLPSISEDDENQSDVEAKQLPSTSPNKNNGLTRSPLHNSSSPRHAKLLQRYGIISHRKQHLFQNQSQSFI